MFLHTGLGESILPNSKYWNFPILDNTGIRMNKKILCLKVAVCICFAMRIWFSKIQAFHIFWWLHFLLPVFMNLYVKIYMKRYDRHNKTHWTSVYRLLELSSYFVSCLSKNQIPYFILDKVCDWLKLDTWVGKKKNQIIKRKLHLESGLPICHKLWDRIFFFFSLILCHIQLNFRIFARQYTVW